LARALAALNMRRNLLLLHDMWFVVQVNGHITT